MPQYVGMEILVRLATNEIVTIKADSSDRVYTVRNKLKDRILEPELDFELIFGGNSLNGQHCACKQMHVDNKNVFADMIRSANIG